MPTCPECGKYVREDERVCPHCGHVADFAEIARKEREKRAAMYSGKTQELNQAQAQKAQVEQQINAIPIVTLQHLPGYEIRRIGGVVTAEIVLGTGFLTEFSTALADLLGTRGTAFETKWKEATEEAFKALRRAAYELNCNAVIGVDMELATVRDIPMIISTGTAVVAEPVAAGK